MKLIVNGRSYEIEVQPDAVVVNGVSFKTTVLHDNGVTTVRVAGRPYRVTIKDERSVLVDGRPFSIEAQGQATVGRRSAARIAKDPADSAGDGALTALMPGTVVEVRVHEGDEVAAGAVLLILEAMKMQNEIKAPRPGRIERVAVAAGQTVGKGDLLVVVG